MLARCTCCVTVRPYTLAAALKHTGEMAMGMHSYQPLVSINNFLTGDDSKCWPAKSGVAHYARSTQAQSTKKL